MARMNAPPDGLFLSGEDEGQSKDIWIPSGTQMTNRPPPAMPEGRIELRRGGLELPSRLIDDLYWLGRYIERGGSHGAPACASASSGSAAKRPMTRRSPSSASWMRCRRSRSCPRANARKDIDAVLACALWRSEPRASSLRGLDAERARALSAHARPPLARRLADAARDGGARSTTRRTRPRATRSASSTSS